MGYKKTPYQRGVRADQSHGTGSVIRKELHQMRLGMTPSQKRKKSASEVTPDVVGDDCDQSLREGKQKSEKKR